MINRVKKKVNKKIEQICCEIVSSISKDIEQGNEHIEEHIKYTQKKIDSCYSRIEAVEQNLNYYNMISDIPEQYEYVNLEFLTMKKYEGKNILLVGFYGAYNLGDELMLQSLLCAMKEEKKIHITVMLCDNLSYDYTDFPNVSIIHYPKNILDYNILAQQYDYLIWGGGALIDDTQYESRNVKNLGNMLLDLSKRFIAFDKKCIMLGLSSNRQISNRSYIDGLRYIVKNSTFFSVRDGYTKEVLMQLEVPKKNIQSISDLVFSHPEWKKKAFEKRK